MKNKRGNENEKWEEKDEIEKWEERVKNKNRDKKKGWRIRKIKDEKKNGGMWKNEEWKERDKGWKI